LGPARNPPIDPLHGLGHTVLRPPGVTGSVKPPESNFTLLSGIGVAVWTLYVSELIATLRLALTPALAPNCTLMVLFG
jgi:hypothetical protein